MKLIEANTNPKAKNIYIAHNYMKHVRTLNFHSNIQSISRCCTVYLENVKNKLWTTELIYSSVNIKVLQELFLKPLRNSYANC